MISEMISETTSEMISETTSETTSEMISETTSEIVIPVVGLAFIMISRDFEGYCPLQVHF